MKTKTSLTRNPISPSLLRHGLFLIPLMIVCFALSPKAQAVLPAPTSDGFYPGDNTAEVWAASLVPNLRGGVAGVAPTVEAALSAFDAPCLRVVFPNKTWKNATPESVGVDPARLQDFAAMVGGSGVVVKDGYMIASWGTQNSRGIGWGSILKSVCSTMLFFAINEGRIPSPNEPVRPYVQQQFPGKDLLPKDVTMTFYHLANHASGYSLPEAPGAAWAHNDYANKLYTWLVYGQLLGANPNITTEIEAAVLARLGSLQFQDGAIVRSRNGTPRWNASVRDTARLAWFWLNKGQWKDQQLIPHEIFDTYAVAQSYNIRRSSGHTVNDYLRIGTMGNVNINTIPVDPSFGFGWKFNLVNGTLQFPGAAPDLFYCQGNRDKFIVVAPSLKLVAAWRDCPEIPPDRRPFVITSLCEIVN